jgi:GNAT superfamily N-acetyltransferase
MSRTPSATRSRRGKSAKSQDAMPVTTASPAAGGGPSPRPARTIRVRSACASDCAAIAALWLEMARTHEPLGKEWNLAEGAGERFARSIPALLGNPRSLCLVAEMEIEGSWRPAGFLLASVKLRSSAYQESVSGEITAIHVAPDASCRGAGTALVGEALGWMRKRGIAQAEAAIPAADRGTCAFWQALGFRENTISYRIAVEPAPVTEPAPAPAPGPRS